MSNLRDLARAAAALLALAGDLAAQSPSEIRAEPRDGQVFITWREGATPGERYRVYRATSPLQKPGDLARADLLGEVDDRTSRNQARSLATGQEQTWIITPGGGPLAQDQGLFVYTIETPAREAYYAVTRVASGVEDLRLEHGRNATSRGSLELPARPRPVFQASDGVGVVWGHWVGNRATPFQPALSLRPSQGFVYRFEPGSAPAPRGLCVRLHAAGQTYSQGWPRRFEVPEDVDILALSDLHPYTSFSFWFGAHERLPGLPDADTRVSNHTQQRVLWTLDGVVEELGATHDLERVSVIGGSMGAIGAMLLAGEAPERFSAILCRNGLYDLRAPDYRNPGLLETLFGSFELDLETVAGLPILTRTNAAAMANLDPRVDWPVIRTLNGRNDETVGWASSVQLFAGLAAASRPAVHYFDERTHNPHGYWLDLERTLLARTFHVRRDRPSLRFDRCTLDDDPGNGERAVGDPVGTLNGYLDYDPRTAAADELGLDFDVQLRAMGALDDAPADAGWAALTPRRTGAFRLAPGELARFTLRSNGVLVDEHLLFPDENGLLHTPLVPLETVSRHTRFERARVPAGPALFLGAAPIPGDTLQAVLFGPPGARWGLVLSLGDERGPASVALSFLRGNLDERGIADLALVLPESLPARAWIWARAWIDGRLTKRVRVQPQFWPGPRGRDHREAGKTALWR